MNTNELADYLDKYALARSVPEQKYIEQAATMLRQQQAEKAVSENLIRHLHAENKELRIENEQQQAEIEALKAELNIANLKWESAENNFIDVLVKMADNTVPAKTLTDEEMRKVINENVENVTVAEMVMFLTVCKATLRKANEK